MYGSSVGFPFLGFLFGVEGSSLQSGLRGDGCSGQIIKWKASVILLMIQILHYFKDPKLWELWPIPYLLRGKAGFISFTLGCRGREATLPPT